MNMTAANSISDSAALPVPVRPAAVNREDSRYEALDRVRNGSSRTMLRGYPVRWRFRQHLQQPPVAPL